MKPHRSRTSHVLECVGELSRKNCSCDIVANNNPLHFGRLKAGKCLESTLNQQEKDQILITCAQNGSRMAVEVTS
jgi:hypothetical protein